VGITTGGILPFPSFFTTPKNPKNEERGEKKEVRRGKS
jgi:hypothetical protein